jgi:hypothetical protein
MRIPSLVELESKHDFEIGTTSPSSLARHGYLDAWTRRLIVGFRGCGRIGVVLMQFKIL